MAINMTHVHPLDTHRDFTNVNSRSSTRIKFTPWPPVRSCCDQPWDPPRRPAFALPPVAAISVSVALAQTSSMLSILTSLLSESSWPTGILLFLLFSSAKLLCQELIMRCDVWCDYFHLLSVFLQSKVDKSHMKIKLLKKTQNFCERS